VTKPRKPKKPGNKYPFEFQYRSKRFYRSFHSREAGAAWVRKMKSDLERGEVGLIQGGTFAEAFTRFKKARKPHLAAGTFSSYETYYAVHMEKQLGARPLAAIDKGAIDDWVSGRLGEGLSTSTVKRMFEVLRAVLSFAVDAKMVSGRPWKGVKLPKNVKVRDVRMLEDDEIEAGLQATAGSPRRRAMVMLALNAGLRIGEIMSMRWEWIDWRRCMIRVPAALEAAFVPKGKTEREIPLMENLRLELLRYMGATTGSGLIFDGVNYKRWSRALRRKAAKILGKLRDPDNEAPLPVDLPFRWHILRHTYVSRLVMAGVALRVVQKVAGHASIRTTELYSHLAPDAYQQITSRFPVGIAGAMADGVLKRRCPTCGAPLTGPGPGPGTTKKPREK
jgi:integrase